MNYFYGILLCIVTLLFELEEYLNRCDVNFGYYHVSDIHPDTRIGMVKYVRYYVLPFYLSGWPQHATSLPN